MQDAVAGSSPSLAAGIPNSSVPCRVTDLFMVTFWFFSPPPKEALASKDQLLCQPDKQEYHLNSFHVDFSLLLTEQKITSCPKSQAPHPGSTGNLQGGTGTAAGTSLPADVYGLC